MLRVADDHFPLQFLHHAERCFPFQFFFHIHALNDKGLQVRMADSRTHGHLQPTRHMNRLAGGGSAFRKSNRSINPTFHWNVRREIQLILDPLSYPQESKYKY